MNSTHTKLLAINREALGGHARVARFKKDQRPAGAAIRTGGSANMLHPTHEQHFMKKVKPIQNGRRPSRQILQSLYAQMMMEYAVFEFNRERLLRKIDDSLDMHDEKAFKEWTGAYKELMSEYKDGKVLFEQGYKLELQFE